MYKRQKVNVGCSYPGASVPCHTQGGLEAIFSVYFQLFSSSVPSLFCYHFCSKVNVGCSYPGASVPCQTQGGLEAIFSVYFQLFSSSVPSFFCYHFCTKVNVAPSISNHHVGRTLMLMELGDRGKELRIWQLKIASH